MRIIIITILNLICIGSFCFAQTKDELASFENLFEPEEKHQHWSYANIDYTNEISFIFSGLYLTYKNFVSSQDLSSCVFTPIDHSINKFIDPVE